MKIAIDTNIILRLLLEDNKQQLEKAKELVRKYRNDNEIFVSNIVFLEMFFVLKSVYEWDEEEICRAFELILRTRQFKIEGEVVLRNAINKCRKGIDFSDALIGQTGVLRNLKTYTFDKKLKKDISFVVL